MITLLQGKKYLINGEPTTFVKTIDQGEITILEKENGDRVKIETELMFEIDLEEIKEED